MRQQPRKQRSVEQAHRAQPHEMAKAIIAQTIGSGIGVRCTVGSTRSHLLSKFHAGLWKSFTRGTTC